MSGRPTPFIRTVIALALCAGIVAAALPALDPFFFPEEERENPDVLQMRGLAELFPGRILFEDPSLLPEPVRQEAARVEDLPRDIRYIRVYQLDAAVAVIAEHASHPALILDLRYLRSEGSGAALAALLIGPEPLPAPRLEGETPDGMALELASLGEAPAVREQPAIVLCNRQTGGPFEALLQSLQDAGHVIGVGEATAGRTAFFQAHDIGRPVWIQHGEISPEAGTSLVDKGFVPRIRIATTAEQNYRNYFAFETGADIRLLVRHDDIAKEEDEEAGEEEDDYEPDPVLQRAVDIIAALQVLERMPESE